MTPLELFTSGLAIGACSLTLTKAEVSTPFRRTIAYGALHNTLHLGIAWRFLSSLFQCPYCLSHWLAALFLLLYGAPVVLSGVLGVLVSWLSLTAIAGATAFGIWQLSTE